METAETLIWRKSSYSTSNGGNCVEVAATPHAIAVRDSKAPHDPAVTFSQGSWEAFTHRVAAGDPAASRYPRAGSCSPPIATPRTPTPG
jgi:hypothetical protein